MPIANVRVMVGFVSVTLVACGGPSAGTVTSVTIDGGDRTIVLGDSLTLTATVEVTGDAAPTVNWTSSEATVATVDTDGALASVATGTTDITATSTADPTKNDSITLTVDPLGDLRWTRQFGDSSNDVATAIAAEPSGNTYTTGHTDGALEGGNAGAFDAFVSSYDSDGDVRWTRQFGTINNDFARGIAVDADGNVSAAGSTFGDLEGGNAGDADAFIRSYDSNGDLRWTRQFGTISDDYATGIAVDADGNVYATGYTSGDFGGGNAGSYDAFVRSYDSDGAVRWTRQFGTISDDVSRGIAADADGNVYATGYTLGDLEGGNAGGNDAFVRSYDRDGAVRWTRQFGTGNDDVATGIATDAEGDIYATGETIGALGGSNAGGDDAFVRSYGSDGDVRWTRQFGTSSDDFATGIATDTNGNGYAAGYTAGGLEGGNAGAEDVFVRSYGR